jgi:hypothetical protein
VSVLSCLLPCLSYFVFVALCWSCLLLLWLVIVLLALPRFALSCPTLCCLSCLALWSYWSFPGLSLTFSPFIFSCSFFSPFFFALSWSWFLVYILCSLFFVLRSSVFGLWPLAFGLWLLAVGRWPLALVFGLWCLIFGNVGPLPLISMQ